MLGRKLWRTIGVYRVQFISMVLMIIIGIGMFVGFNMEWYTIERDLTTALDASNFADYRIYSESGFDEAALDSIKDVDGVDAAARFLSVNATVDGSSDTLAVTVTSDPKVSFFSLTEGDEYDADSENGIWLSDKYAAANDVSIGDELTVVYKNIKLDGRVVGLIKSAEYLICVADDTQLMPDFTTHGFAYISPAMLGRCLGTEFYTQLNIISDLDKPELVERAEKALGKTLLVLSNDENPSYSQALGESDEGKTMGLVLPVLFLSIAVLTMVTTMNRITAKEKTQIGTFKALGYRDRRIAAHYTSYATAIGLIGTLFGIGFGVLVAWYIMNPNGSMGTYTDFIDWSLYCPAFVWIVLIVINLFITAIGWLSVRQALGDTAADALRPYSPKRFKPLAWENCRAWKKLGFGFKWNTRDTLRHKARTAMTLFGVLGCVVLIIAALGMKDTMASFIQVFYYDAAQYESVISLDSETVTPERAEELRELYSGDGASTVSIQLDGDSTTLTVYDLRRNYIRFPDTDYNMTKLPDNGVYICSRIERDYDVHVGDELEFSPYVTDDSYTVRVRGVICSMTEGIVMSRTAAENAGIDYHCNTIYTAQTDIVSDEAITAVQSKQSIIDSFDTFMAIMNLMIVLLCGGAVLLGVIVLYNLGTMSYTERYREMATLKVLGFRDGRIGSLLIQQNLVLTLIGTAIGLPAGYFLLRELLVLLASEYELSLTVSPLSYIETVLITLGMSLLVGLLISRKNKKIDMVEALKAAD